MPLDIMVGYIVYDSLARSLHTPGADEVYNNLTYSDTLRYAMKYCYKMMDYNPILFEQFMTYNAPPKRLAGARNEVFYRLRKKITETSPFPFVETLLCQSGIIAHIRVTDTFSVAQPTSNIIRTHHVVTSEVLDKIKGQQLPDCINFYPNEQEQDDTPLPLITSESCLQFFYSLDWQRIPFGSNIVATEETMVDENGVPWVQKDREYIVFLSLINGCSDSLYNYLLLSAFGIRSSSNNIYPIVDGKVVDPDNDFGLGVTPTVTEFKNALRQRIHTITHFGE